MTDAGVCIGIDCGDARIGVAVSDALGVLARPLTTVPAQPQKAALAELADLARRHCAVCVILGLPIRADGEEGTAAAKARAFAALLLPLLPQGVGIHFQDEFRSTMTAAGYLRAKGQKGRDQRKSIDQTAAAVILQEWLDTRQPPPGAA